RRVLVELPAVIPENQRAMRLSIVCLDVSSHRGLSRPPMKRLAGAAVSRGGFLPARPRNRAVEAYHEEILPVRDSGPSAPVRERREPLPIDPRRSDDAPAADRPRRPRWRELRKARHPFVEPSGERLAVKGRIEEHRVGGRSRSERRERKAVIERLAGGARIGELV